MKHFLAALQFLTALPMGRSQRFEPRSMVPFFPVVGLVLGGILFLMDRGFLQLWSPEIAALLDVVALAAFTGALHLDGLGDTADGLYGRRAPQEALAIMKDSRIGVMGLTAVVCCLALKWAGIAGLSSDRGLLLILVPAYARCGILFGMLALPYGRPEGGTGSAFFQRPPGMVAFWSLVPLVALSLALGWRSLVLNGAFAVIVSAVLYFYHRKIGCITGDMLGGLTEILEAGLFLAVSAEVLP